MAQTNKGNFEPCLGGGVLTNKVNELRVFKANTAHAMVTAPLGLHLYTKLNEQTCVYGFELPRDEYFHHLQFLISSASVYIDKSREVSLLHGDLSEEVKVQLKLYQRNDHKVELASLKIKVAVQTDLIGAVVRVYRKSSSNGVVYFSIDHNIPPGMVNVVFLQLKLIVTPIYVCNFEDYLAKSISHKSSSVWLAGRLNAYFLCTENVKRNKSARPNFCIPRALLCDNYPNCPFEGHALSLDESTLHCVSYEKSLSTKMQIMLVITSFTSVLALVLMAFWLIKTRRFICCSQLSHQTFWSQILRPSTAPQVAARNSLRGDCHPPSQLNRTHTQPPSYEEIMSSEAVPSTGQPKGHTTRLAIRSVLNRSSLSPTDSLIGVNERRSRLNDHPPPSYQDTLITEHTRTLSVVENTPATPPEEICSSWDDDSQASAAAIPDKRVNK